MKSNYSAENKFYHIYRGFVVNNEDPLNKGRIKIFVPGVYSSKFMDVPEQLPWALPAMSIFGGGSTNKHREGVLNKEVGWSSVPHMGNVETGAQVFVFFENGNINHPVYFAVSQSGEGWISEHPDQHVFNSDNVRIRIDESAFDEEKNAWATDEKSTCRFDSYTKNIPELGKKQLEKDCEKNTWNFSDGQIKNLETRIDIEVKADNINAINLNIHGNVNMHIDGDWFVEHIGNKFEYQKGDHYIKHDGSTYIEQKGIYKNIQEGNRSYIQTGKYNYIQTGDALITRTGTLFEKVNSNVKKEYDQKFDLTVGGKTNEIYGDDRTIDIMGNYTKTIKKNSTEDVIGNIEITTFGHYECVVNDNITFITKKGNWTVRTEGLFELFDSEDNLTVDGYKNLGNKGNIEFISTFGNINLQCIKNDDVANFSKKSVVIPWNPGFLAEIEKNIAMFPTFNKIDAVTKGLNFPTDIFDFGGFISFFKSLPNLLIYDGLPVFLPTKMIFQNPNIPSPNNTDDLNWIPKFRSEVNDWRSGDNESYWKIPGRMMGNINIETWSGDINIKTESELGCAGNINITATEKTGTFPGYQIGCVNIKNSAKRRIYPDPRDLFFDSDFMMKNSGQLKLFSHGTNIKDAAKKKNLLLPDFTSSLISQLGFSITLNALDYDDFYKVNGMNILTNGFSMEDASGVLVQLADLQSKPGPKLGCLKCIADYFLGIPGIQDLCYVSENLNNFSSVGIHRYGFSKFNPFDNENPRGVFNILSMNYDQISMGDGHAIENGFTDREIGGKNIGSFNLTSDTDISLSSGKNYYTTSNTSKPDATRSVSHIVTDKVWDDFPPSILVNGINGINKLWSATGGIIFEIDDGVVKILKGLISIDTGIELLNIMPKLRYISLGYVNTLTEKIGKKITYSDKENNTYDLDLGFNFENLKDLLSSGDFSKLKVCFNKEKYLEQKYNGTFNKTYESGSFGKFEISNFTPNIAISFELNEDYHSYVWNDNNLKYNKTHTFDDKFSLYWNLKQHDASKLYIPDWEFKNEFKNSYNLGNGITKNESITDISKYGYHDPILINNVLEPIPEETYIDINKNEQYITSKSDSTWESFLMGPPRNINFNEKLNAGNIINDIKDWDAEKDIKQKYNFDTKRSTSKVVTYASPINTNILTLHSNNIWEDEENKIIYSTNLLKTEIKGTNTESEYDDNSEWHREISNNIDFNQYGFPLNNIKVNNGVGDKNTSNNIYIDNGSNIEVDNTINRNINTFSIKNGKNVAASNNSFEIENGGNAEAETNSFTILNGNMANESKNSFDIFNGIDGNGTDKVVNENSLSINNGRGEFTKNDFVLNNGHGTGNLSNFTINNCGTPGNSTDTFILNNNNNETELQMIGAGPDTGMIKVFSSLSKQDDIKNTYTLNVENQIENTKIKTFNNNDAFIITTNAFTTNVVTLNAINSDQIVINGNKTISATAPAVNISKLIAVGTMNGDFTGSFSGYHAGEGAIAPGKFSLINPQQPSPNVNLQTPPAPTMTKIGAGPIISVIKNLLVKFLEIELSFFKKYF